LPRLPNRAKGPRRCDQSVRRREHFVLARAESLLIMARDLFRGIANWALFLGDVANNIVNGLSTKNQQRS